MANYYARVELHGASWPNDYVKLHESLKKHGFTNCVPDTKNASWRLPPAFYFSQNSIDDVSIVAQAVRECANSTGYKNEVVVVKSTDSRFYLSSAC